MSKIAFKAQAIAIESLANDLRRLVEIKEKNQEKIEGLVISKLKEESVLMKAIEMKVENLTQIARTWHKPFAMRYNYPSSVSATTVIHCKQCLANVVVSRSTQTLHTSIQANKANNSTSIKKQKPLRSILRKSNSGKLPESSKSITDEETKTKTQPLFEWSAMEWNGKDEIEEINHKIIALDTKIGSISKHNRELIENPIVIKSYWKDGASAQVSAMEQRLNQLEEDILYLDSSL